MAGLVTAAAPATATLPPLRQDLRLAPGPPEQGAPTWIVHDPAANRFLQLGELEVEILSHWSLGEADAVARAASRKGPPVTVDEVRDLAQALDAHSLLRPTTAEAVDRLAEKAARSRRAGARGLGPLLFPRIPLGNPDPLLRRLVPLANLLCTRFATALFLLLSVGAVHLAWQEREAFVSSLAQVFTPHGLLAGGLAMVAGKTAHELAHGLAARRLGLPVATMGVAFLAMFPLPYTDVSHSWLLADRSQRLRIAAAGMLAELALAVLAVWAWALLDPGVLRSAFQLLAVVNLGHTLAVNANPLMRFDGYHMLVDLLRMENLMDRAMAQARWLGGRWLLGLRDPAPEPAGRLSPTASLALGAYGVACVVYRFLIVFGIAGLLYAMAFKALAVVLAGVYLLATLLPMARTALAFFRRRGGEMASSGRAWVSLLAAAALLASLAVPWRTSVRLQAVLRPRQSSGLFAPLPAQVDEVLARQGQWVDAGAPLYRLRAPALDRDEAVARTRLELHRLQLATMGSGADLTAQRLTAMAQRDRLEARLEALARQRQELELRAPHAGRVELGARPLQAGQWVAAGDRLALIHDTNDWVAAGYLRELDLDRLRQDRGGTFFPDAAHLAAIGVGAPRIAVNRAGKVEEAMLSALHGGEVAVARGRHEDLSPVEAIYLLQCRPEGAFTPPAAMLRGELRLEGRPASVLRRIWRRLAGLFQREAVF